MQVGIEFSDPVDHDLAPEIVQGEPLTLPHPYSEVQGVQTIVEDNALWDNSQGLKSAQIESEHLHL